MTLQRRSPLRRSKPLRTRSKVRSGARADSVPVRLQDGRAEAFGRSGGLCVLCVVNGQPKDATDAHHRKLRSQGGDDSAANLLPLCSWHHHDVIHRYPEMSKAEGFIVPMWDVVTPWWQLDWWTDRRAS